MKFTKEQLLSSANPYLLLQEAVDEDEDNFGDNLAENSSVFNELSSSEKNALAIGLVFKCPDSDLKALALHIRALQSPLKSNEPSFHSLLKDCYEVKRRINELADPATKEVYKKILDADFAHQLMHKYPLLVALLVADKESAIAERIALSAPIESRSAVAQWMDRLFPKSILATEVASAFTLIRAIETQLLTEKPEVFFTNPEYNRDLCWNFPNLMQAKLENEIPTLNKLLRADQTTEIRERVRRELIHLGTRLQVFAVVYSNICVTEISDRFDMLGVTEGFVDGDSLGVNPYSLFNNKDATTQYSPQNNINHVSETNTNTNTK